MLMPWLVLITAIIVFFMSEWMSLAKKIASIPGFKLWGPLTLASWLVVQHEPIIRWMLGLMHAWIQIHWDWGVGVKIIELFLCAVVPLLLLWYQNSKLFMVDDDEKLKSLELLALVLWIMAMFLLVLPVSE